jgi:hypothetical protein
MNEEKLLERITVNPGIFGGKPIIRGRRLAVEHVLGMKALRSGRRLRSRDTLPKYHAALALATLKSNCLIKGDLPRYGRGAR